MTKRMFEALVVLCRNGSVFPGPGNDFGWGCYYRISASSIRGLASRGFCVIRTSPDGGIMGVRP